MLIIITIFQGNDTEEIYDRPDMTFSCKQKRNSDRFEILYQSIFISDLM